MITIADKERTPVNMSAPLRYALDLLGGKWKMPIISILFNRKGVSARYGEIKALLPGITNTMLSQSLKELEQAGLVRRTQYNEIPPRVEYSLTEDIDELEEALCILDEWGRKRMAKDLGEDALPPLPEDCCENKK